MYLQLFKQAQSCLRFNEATHSENLTPWSNYVQIRGKPFATFCHIIAITSFLAPQITTVTLHKKHTARLIKFNRACGQMSDALLQFSAHWWRIFETSKQAVSTDSQEPVMGVLIHSPTWGILLRRSVTPGKKTTCNFTKNKLKLIVREMWTFVVLSVSCNALKEIFLQNSLEICQIWQSL